MNPVLDCLSAHRSIRRFAARRVPDKDVRAAVAAAQCSATSHWVQAYALIQIEETSTRARLRELCGDQIQVEQAGAFFVVCADARRHRLIADQARSEYLANFETFLASTIDAALFAQSLALAFEASGWGICFIGGLRNRLSEVDELLALPEHVFPLFGLCVGEPAEDPPTRPRLAPEGVWSKERYPRDREVLQAVSDFDRAAGRWFEAQNQPGRDWSGLIWRLHKKLSRESLAAYYRSKGARLA